MSRQSAKPLPLEMFGDRRTVGARAAVASVLSAGFSKVPAPAIG